MLYVSTESPGFKVLILGELEKMKIGLVSYFNARPLDYGLRLRAEQPGSELELVQETPARLYEALMAGKLDAALISSVEVLRNPQKLGYCDSVGVCAREQVKSILYIRRRGADGSLNPDQGDFTDRIPERVYTDSGSRTSVALLQTLLYEGAGKVVPVIPTPPEDIPDLLNETSAGLLIGDSAIRFLASPRVDEFHRVDLAAWWSRKEGLPFVFALWAYPLDKPVTHDVFEESLARGREGMDEIIAAAPFEGAREYLTNILHYRLTDRDRAGLARFKELLRASELL